MAAEPRDQTNDKPAREKSTVEILARASLGRLHVGLLQVGLEGTYMLTPHLGFGATYEAFYVDNGADPQYSPSGTLDSGWHGMTFVEGDLFEGFITPYARLGLGAGRYARYQQTYLSGHTEAELDFAGQAAAGLALRLGPVLARGWAAPSLYGKDFVMVYGAGLGGRF